jgi:hypothetical protein
VRVNINIDPLSAPKGHKDSAQGFNLGFNPGLLVPMKCALKASSTPLRGVQFGEGTLDLWCSSVLGVLSGEHQQGGLASNPKPQWCLVVAKPD